MHLKAIDEDLRESISNHCVSHTCTTPYLTKNPNITSVILAFAPKYKTNPKIGITKLKKIIFDPTKNGVVPPEKHEKYQHLIKILGYP